MPMSWRPKVKKIISGVTSPAGAFAVGLFVTIFLLPCTIGPYVILGGMLSFMEILKTLPMLLLYNAIFILPIVIITLLVYFGLSRVEDVQNWKDKNVRIMHLIAGLLISGIGIAMIFEWV
jgi:cytochrome c biogenesis protein CcdA